MRFTNGKQYVTWSLVLLVALTLVLAACSGTQTSPATSSSSSTTSSNTSEQAEATTAPAESEAETTPATAGEPAATEEPAAEESTTETEPPAQEQTQEVVENTKFNLNEATEADFLTVPDVGNRMVREFFEYRPYVSIQQFRREIGKYVDESQVAAYEEYVYVPVDPNESDEATIQQIPGVDESVSAELVAGRPYADNAAFLDAVAALAGDNVRAAAAGYLVGE